MTFLSILFNDAETPSLKPKPKCLDALKYKALLEKLKSSVLKRSSRKFSDSKFSVDEKRSLLRLKSMIPGSTKPWSVQLNENVEIYS